MTGAGAPEPSSAPAPALDQQFRQQLARTDISKLLQQDNEDTVACDLLIQTCELFLRHLALPNAIEAIVKPDPDRKKPSLHARLSFTFMTRATASSITASAFSDIRMRPRSSRASRRR